MNRERFSKSDLRLTAAMVLVIAVCLVYIRLEYDKAFPQASIKLVLSKAAITDLARKFLDRRGLKTAGFRELTIFDPDDDARLYLERELGLAARRCRVGAERDVPAPEVDPRVLEGSAQPGQFWQGEIGVHPLAASDPDPQGGKA